MVLSEEKIRNYTKRLLVSRMRILCTHGFYGLLLMHVDFYINYSLLTAATDGSNIIFNPDFLDELSDPELDFIMMHEILHMALSHCSRQGDRDHNLFNIACDIVVNSNILKSNNMDPDSITLTTYGESMHLTPDGEEGFLYTAEQVYEMLKSAGSEEDPIKQECDTHELWQSDPDTDAEWGKRVADACEAVASRGNGASQIPASIERLIGKVKEIQTDWRSLLNEFIQEEITDYSFTPPDRRFDDSPFFLPDFNDKEYSVADILFMVDASGSISNKELTEIYSEVSGAMEQFQGKLRGWIGFFDSTVHSVQKFDNIDDLQMINKTLGYGGTDFSRIFEYVNTKMQNDEIKKIIILTDGLAPFPDETATHQIPVLWMITNERITPPWGQVCRIIGKDKSD